MYIKAHQKSRSIITITKLVGLRLRVENRIMSLSARWYLSSIQSDSAPSSWRTAKIKSIIPLRRRVVRLFACDAQPSGPRSTIKNATCVSRETGERVTDDGLLRRIAVTNKIYKNITARSARVSFIRVAFINSLITALNFDRRFSLSCTCYLLNFFQTHLH